MWSLVGKGSAAYIYMMLAACGKVGGCAPGSAGAANGSAAPPCTTCRIFVSASSYDGNLGGPAGADAKCMADANKPAGGSAYKALVMAAGVRSLTLDWVMKPSRAYYRPDGTTIIATTTANAEFTSLDNAFGTINAYAHTGFSSSSPWTVGSANFNCSGNTSNGSIFSDVGYINDSRISYAVGGGGQPCANPQRLYCVEQ